MIQSPENMTPFEYLDYLQSSCGASTTEISDNHIRQRHEDKLQSLSNQQSYWRRALEDELTKDEATPLQTRQEIRCFGDMVRLFQNQIEESIRILGKEPPTVAVGTLPLGDVNAATIPVPSGGYVIAFNVGLFGFIYQMATVIGELLVPDSTGEDRVRYTISKKQAFSKLAESSESNDRFVDVLVSYLLHGNPWQAKKRFPDETVLDVANLLSISAELFVLGHEYAHIIGEHVGEVHSIKVGDATVEAINQDWAQEIVADWNGALLMLSAQARKGLPASLTYWGAHFFFSCAAIVEDILFGEEESASHPSALLRKEYLDKQVAPHISEKEQWEHAVGLSGLLHEIVGECWNRNKARFNQKLTEQGGLAPLWRK
ncbi:hypothetical protein ACFL30_02520 [Candidatus Latescibacterota bacterium]